MKNFIVAALLLSMAFPSCNPRKQNNMNIEFDWKRLPTLPAAKGQSQQPGLAGAITGLIGDELLIAGGSNFPDALPWLGGTKTYYNEMYSLNLQDTAAGWRREQSKLPEPMAYAACVSVNNNIYCVGGENSDNITSRVLKISRANDQWLVGEQTNFPVAVSNASISAIGDVIYVVGGLGNGQALSSFYAANTAENSLKWEKLPDIPVAFSHAVVVSQWDEREQCIYVLGGRNKTGILTEFFSAVWKYSPSDKRWSQVGDITNQTGDKMTLAAGTGGAYDRNYILLFGGDKGGLFNKTEDFIHRISVEKDHDRIKKLTNKKNSHLSSHPGFSRDVFLYNTKTNQCSVIEQMPFPAQVTTTAIRKGNDYIIPNGEIKPGVRTPEISWVKVVNKND